MGQSHTTLPVIALALALATTSCNSLPQGEAGTELLNGEVGVTVDRYELAYLDFESDNGIVRTSEEPILLIHLTVNNHSAASIRYDIRDTATATQQSLTPLLFSDPGEDGELGHQNHIPLLSLSEYRYLADPISGPTGIEPGESLSDVLLFAQPPANTSTLILSVPPSVFGPGIEAPALIRIPYTPSDPTRPLEGAQGSDYVGDGFVFNLVGTEVSYPPNMGRSGFTERPVLALTITIQNSSGENLNYTPTHRNASNSAVPELTDGTRFYDRLLVPPDQQIQGQLIGDQTIPPLETITDLLLFERPEPEVTELLLTFPAHLVSRHGLIRVRLPYAYSDPPLPPELTGPVTPTTPEEGAAPVEGTPEEEPQP